VTSLHTRLARAPQPALTWYGDDGERVELSGPVLAQWVTKASNLLVEELDAGPGYRVLVDLPGHWRAVVWALAVWRVGACVVVPDEAREAPATDAVLTATPSSFAGRRGVVAVALPALARSFPDALPDGGLDGSTVLSYGDALGYVPDADPGAPALTGPSGAAAHADLVRPGGDAGRVLVDATTGPLDATLRAVLDVLAAGGSVVLVGGAYAERLRADDERRARLVATERITAAAPPAG
jgi:uncharacterized protein (TIGR03089 family)